MKVLFGMPLGLTTGFVQSLLQIVELDWDVPDNSRLCRPLPGRRFAKQICREGPEVSEREPTLSRGNRAVEITSSNIGDAPMLPELLNQMPPDPDIGSVTAPSWQHALHAPDGQSAPNDPQNPMSTTRYLPEQKRQGY